MHVCFNFNVFNRWLAVTIGIDEKFAYIYDPYLKNVQLEYNVYDPLYLCHLAYVFKYIENLGKVFGDDRFKDSIISWTEMAICDGLTYHYQPPEDSINGGVYCAFYFEQKCKKINLDLPAEFNAEKYRLSMYDKLMKKQ